MITKYRKLSIGGIIFGIAIIAVIGIIGLTNGMGKRQETATQGWNHSISTNKNMISGFSIYLVKDKDYSKIGSINLNEISLEKEPVLTEKDIVSCDWNASDYGRADESVKSKISIRLKDNVNLIDRIKAQGHNSQMTCFVVKAGNDRIFLGTFYLMITSMSPPSKVYVLSPLDFGDRKSIVLLDESNKDLVHDKRIYNAIINAGIGIYSADSNAFNEAKAISLVIKDHTDFPSKQTDTITKELPIGGKAGSTAKVKFTTKVDKVSESDYVITLTKDWGISVNGKYVKSYWKYEVIPNSVTLLESVDNDKLIATIK